MALPVGGIEGGVHILHLRSLWPDILLKNYGQHALYLLGDETKSHMAGTHKRLMKEIKLICKYCNDQQK